MRTSIRLATTACIGAAAIALTGCGLIDSSEPDATAPAESTAAPTPSEPEPSSADTAACDPAFDAATDDAAMEPLVGEWVSEEQSIFGAEYPEESKLCIEADGTVTYEAPQGIWEGHLTLGDESANQIVLDPAEGNDAEGYLVDLNYDADEETIGLVESGDDGRWYTYVRAQEPFGPGANRRRNRRHRFTGTVAQDGTEIEVGLEYDENADTLTLTYPGEDSSYVHTRA